MTAEAQSTPRRWRPVILGTAIALAVVGIFLAANAHLLYVALQSQPDCVAHVKPGDVVLGQPSAAKSAC